MRRGFSAVPFALWLAALGLLSSGPAAGQDSFGERIEVNLVNVEIYVTDKAGNPVPGLQRGDFEILEDGKRMEIVNFQAFDRKLSAASSPDAPGSQTPASGGPSVSAPSAASPDGQHLVVYIDNTFLVPGNRNRVLRQLRDTLDQLAPEDRVMLVTQDPALRIRLPFSADRAAVRAALDEIEGMAASGINAITERRRALEMILAIREASSRGPGGNPCALEIAEPARSYAEATRGEVLRTVRALTILVNSLSGIPGRKALLLVSDGMPLTPGEEVFELLYELCGPGAGTSGLDLGPLGSGDAVSYDGGKAPMDAQTYSTANELNSLAAHANANQVTLYALQASGLQGTAAASAEYGPNERMLQLPSITFTQNANLRNSLNVLATETGGRAVFDANDVRKDVARIQEDFGSYYSLGFSPPHFGDGREHRLEIRVKKPGLKARHRKSYRDKPALERTADRTLATLFHGIEDNPLEISVGIGQITPGAEGAYAVPVQLRIPLFRLSLQDRNNEIQGKLRVLVATQDPKGVTSSIRQVEVPIRIPREKALTALGQYYLYEVRLTLRPGEQRIALAVRDEATALTSFLEQKVRVEAAAAEAPSP